MSLPDAWWPWLTVAGLGVVHGLSPANGWLFVAYAVRGGGARATPHPLLSIALGHTLSVGLVVALAMQGMRLAPDRMQTWAGAGLLTFAAWRLARPHRRAEAAPVRGSRAGLVTWSCLMGTTHGSGLILVPALVPLCMTNEPARAITASGSPAWMLAAVALHLLAMLGTVKIVAHAVRLDTRPCPCTSDTAYTLVLALTGGALIVLR